MQTLGGVRGFLTVPSLRFPPALLPLLHLLQQLILSCGRASALRGPSAGRGCPSPAAGCWPGVRGPLAGRRWAAAQLSRRSASPREDPGGAGRRPVCTRRAPHSVKLKTCNNQSGREAAGSPYSPGGGWSSPPGGPAPGRVRLPAVFFVFFFLVGKCCPRWPRGGGRTAGRGFCRPPSVRLILEPPSPVQGKGTRS